MRASASWARPLAGGLALVLVMALSAPLAAADQPAPRPPAAPIAASTATVVAKLGPPPARALAQDAGAVASTDSGDSFFGSTKGRLAVALLAAGVIITAVSRNKDAVQSPAR